MQLTADLFFSVFLACTQALTNRVLTDACSRTRILNYLLTFLHKKIFVRVKKKIP